ncbi:transmembrane protein adipocyte-associated 1 homolog [Tubulanus polymorphus]|uniref:transmembrane protein adipocyte-associated 1 homolog n=1 Tax=Tubulanus polymorphus TaxID=672921 RepID=UPI003DA523F7
MIVEMENGSTTTPITSTTSAVITPNASISPQPIQEHFCQAVLFDEIGSGDKQVRIWDLIIFLPNTVFLIFLLCQIRPACKKLKSSQSPIFTAFYGLVLSVAIVGEVRCIVSMSVNAAKVAGDVTDRVLWLLLRFSLLATEMSVLVFGLAFGHLDSRTSIRRVLFVTFFLALIYSVAQGTLEFVKKDNRRISSPSHNFDIFGHGGMIFFCASSSFFFIIYFVISILPLLSLPSRYPLPTRRGFYYYTGFLCIMNAATTIGSALIYSEITDGICVVDVTTFIYFALFAPLIYGTFLREFFKTVLPTSILFSYKTQIDELADDEVIMPHQSSTSATDTSATLTIYDSTQFDTNSCNITPSPNPLYMVASMPADNSTYDYSINT